MRSCSVKPTKHKERLNYNSFFDTPTISNCVLPNSKESTEISIKNSASSIKKPSNFLTCSEINDLIDSLVSKKSSKTSTSSNNQIPKTSGFEVNFKQVTPMTKTMIERRKRLKSQTDASTSIDYFSSINQNEVNEMPQDSKSYINSYSRTLIDETLERKIKEIFGDSIEFTKQELENIFHQLGILEKGDKINNRSVFRETLLEWEVDDNLYDAASAQNEILLAINGDTKTDFRRIVRNRINTNLVNKKNPKIPYVQKDMYQGSHFITTDVLDRITQPKPPPPTEEPIEKIEYSKNSRKVLNKSIYGKENFLRRVNSLDERKKERKQKIINDIEEEIEKKKEKEKIIPIVSYSPEKLKSRLYFFKNNTDSDNSDEEEQRKPRYIIPYEEYCEYRDLINKKHKREKKPSGWESHFQRMQDGRIQKIIKKKEEEKYSRIDIPVVKVPKYTPKELPNEVYLIHNNPPQKKIEDLKPIDRKKFRGGSVSPRKKHRKRDDENNITHFKK